MLSGIVKFVVHEGINTSITQAKQSWTFSQSIRQTLLSDDIYFVILRTTI